MMEKLGESGKATVGIRHRQRTKYTVYYTLSFDKDLVEVVAYNWSQQNLYIHAVQNVQNVQSVLNTDQHTRH